MKVAIVGGSGFVGTRLLETWRLLGHHEPRLLVRHPGSLARASRFPLPDWRAVNALDPTALADALVGCDAMVHAMVGTPKQIETAARAAREACLRAGVGRLVYLSSASVHGQSPPPGTDDRTPLHTRHLVEYNNAKVRAERQLTRDSGVEVAILRPGIVYGPRCQWFSSLPTMLEGGRAFLVDGGHGVCNHIYVDNLVHAIDLALEHERACDGPYYVGDDESRCWREFYRPIVEQLGFSIDDLISVPIAPAPLPPSRTTSPRDLPGARLVAAALSRRVKNSLKAGAAAYAAPPPVSGFTVAAPESPTPDWETSELHTCRTRLSWNRAKDSMGYEPQVSAAAGLLRSAMWASEILSRQHVI